ncbi:MAG TPA: hypothetical protein PLB91_01675 [Spirochaetales bacterium]|nr:hypothetical protein [Spirochaetales bacterium]HRY55249.1 hypothetical protein [Spirochaetia bacterium]HRZ64206.1 hypothetical protein [Spirochaetia bacterium]
MLIPALRRYLEAPPLVATPAYELSYRLLAERRRLAGGRRYQILALLILRGEEINFPEIAGRITEDLSRRGAKRFSIEARWIVCSNRGGIYLYEAVATKENRKLGPLRSRFLVLDYADGTVSLGPGHLDNERFSRAMAYLIERQRTMPEAEWRRAFEGILGECLARLGGA